MILILVAYVCMCGKLNIFTDKTRIFVSVSFILFWGKNVCRVFFPSPLFSLPSHSTYSSPQIGNDVVKSRHPRICQGYPLVSDRLPLLSTRHIRISHSTSTWFRQKWQWSILSGPVTPITYHILTACFQVILWGESMSREWKQRWLFLINSAQNWHLLIQVHNSREHEVITPFTLLRSKVLNDIKVNRVRWSRATRQFEVISWRWNIVKLPFIFIKSYQPRLKVYWWGEKTRQIIVQENNWCSHIIRDCNDGVFFILGGTAAHLEIIYPHKSFLGVSCARLALIMWAKLLFQSKTFVSTGTASHSIFYWSQVQTNGDNHLVCDASHVSCFFVSIWAQVKSAAQICSSSKHRTNEQMPLCFFCERKFVHFQWLLEQSTIFLSLNNNKGLVVSSVFSEQIRLECADCLESCFPHMQIVSVTCFRSKRRIQKVDLFGVGEKQTTWGIPKRYSEHRWRWLYNWLKPFYFLASFLGRYEEMKISWEFAHCHADKTRQFSVIFTHRKLAHGIFQVSRWIATKQLLLYLILETAADLSPRKLKQN